MVQRLKVAALEGMGVRRIGRTSMMPGYLGVDWVMIADGSQ
jgi:hypothetical protein